MKAKEKETLVSLCCESSIDEFRTRNGRYYADCQECGFPCATIVKDQSIMNMETVYESLCIMDERNPCHADVTAYEREEDEPIPAPREKGCACDSCFYGKDSLAVEIIRLQEKLKKGATQ